MVLRNKHQSLTFFTDKFSCKRLLWYYISRIKSFLLLNIAYITLKTLTTLITLITLKIWIFRHLRIADSFAQTLMCPPFGGFTVFLSFCCKLFILGTFLIFIRYMLNIFLIFNFTFLPGFPLTSSLLDNNLSWNIHAPCLLLQCPFLVIL